MPDTTAKNPKPPQSVIDVKNLFVEVLNETLPHTVDLDEETINAIANDLAKKSFMHFALISDATIAWFKYLQAIGVIKPS